MSQINTSLEEEIKLATSSAENDKPLTINTDSIEGFPEWTNFQKIAFRVALPFFIFLSIPNNPEWYKHVFEIDWTQLHYRDLYDIARFGSGINFFGNTIFGNSLQGYANWIITFAISLVIGLIWTAVLYFLKKDNQEYYKLHYWLRAIVRYRAGIGIIGFGFTKLLPVQMPYPSFGVLDTNFGDLTSQKIFWLSVAIVPWYQIFTGIVEVLAGSFLLFRKTTTLGAVLLFGALGDIVYVNFAYDGGVHVYSSYFVLLSAFLLVPDVTRYYTLFIKEKIVIPYHYLPSFPVKWQQYTRVSLKTLTIFIFLPLFFYYQLINFLYDPYKQPSTPGVNVLRGNYLVSEFKINGKSIEYSPLDSVRWSEVTFEKWTTLTYKVNKATALDLSNGGGDPQKDINRTFEISGVSGGRRVFHYYADTVNKVLYLQDKYKEIPDRRNRTAGVGGDGGVRNQIAAKAEEKKPDTSDIRKKIYGKNWIPETAKANFIDELHAIHPLAISARRIREFEEFNKKEAEGKGDKRNKMILKYETTDGDKIILTGTDEYKNEIYLVLDRVEKENAITPSSLSAGKYD